MSRRPRQVGGGRGVTDPSRPRTERSAQPRTREERSGAPQRSAVKALREEPPHRTAPLPLPEGTAQRTARGRSGSEGWRLRTAPRGQRRGTQPGTQTRLRCPTADPTRPGTATKSPPPPPPHRPQPSGTRPGAAAVTPPSLPTKLRALRDAFPSAGRVREPRAAHPATASHRGQPRASVSPSLPAVHGQNNAETGPGDTADGTFPQPRVPSGMFSPPHSPPLRSAPRPHPGTAAPGAASTMAAAN